MIRISVFKFAFLGKRFGKFKLGIYLCANESIERVTFDQPGTTYLRANDFSFAT